MMSLFYNLSLFIELCTVEVVSACRAIECFSKCKGQLIKGDCHSNPNTSLFSQTQGARATGRGASVLNGEKLLYSASLRPERRP